jgi:hypothetical protein
MQNSGMQQSENRIQIAYPARRQAGHSDFGLLHSDFRLVRSDFLSNRVSLLASRF